MKMYLIIASFSFAYNLLSAEIPLGPKHLEEFTIIRPKACELIRKLEEQLAEPFAAGKPLSGLLFIENEFDFCEADTENLRQQLNILLAIPANITKMVIKSDVILIAMSDARDN